MFKRKRAGFLSWEDYQAKVAVREMHAWQQRTRRQSMINSPGPGVSA